MSRIASWARRAGWIAPAVRSGPGSVRSTAASSRCWVPAPCTALSMAVSRSRFSWFCSLPTVGLNSRAAVFSQFSLAAVRRPLRRPSQRSRKARVCSGVRVSCSSASNCARRAVYRSSAESPSRSKSAIGRPVLSATDTVSYLMQVATAPRRLRSRIPPELPLAGPEPALPSPPAGRTLPGPARRFPPASSCSGRSRSP